MTQLNLTRDIAGSNTFGLPFAKIKYDTTLLAGVEQLLTVPGPSSKYLAIFSIEPGTSIWVANNTTAVVAGAAFTATNSELNPVAREVKATDVLHFITTNTNATVGVSFYAIQ
jgi:hypothetical protein